jgi:adenine deaminase
MKDGQIIYGHKIDVFNRTIFPARITVAQGKIHSVEQLETTAGVNKNWPYVLPGFIDSHVHIESSLLIPSEFARMAVVHGTVATVSDPHEIANVCGMEGVEFMVRNGMKVPFKFNFGAPSCVPATIFETAGATLNTSDVEQLLERDDILYLSEMMNFPGVLNGDPDVKAKILAACKKGKPVDGHAPGLRGEMVQQYIDAGISSDHECFTYEEALDKLQRGMKIIIREGSAARNFNALIPLLHEYPEKIMFCSDDKHPDSLLEGHINTLCKRAIAAGIPLFHVLQAACVNPILHYGLKVGLLREGDPADMILVKDLTEWEVLETYVDGIKVAEKGVSLIHSVEEKPINHFHANPIKAASLRLHKTGGQKHPVIVALDGQLITEREEHELKEKEGLLVPDTDKDLLKIVVLNRYADATPAVGFIRNFGLKSGAMASSVAHDSHNIVAVGADDESITQAINLVIMEKGGLSCVSDTESRILPLPVGGLMNNIDGYQIAREYIAIDGMAKALGSCLGAPFMTLSFMALLVIPHLKMSDRGLFNVDKFSFVPRGD